MPASTSLVGWIMRPLSRLLVGFIAIPALRAVRRRIPGVKEWDGELEKDVEQWFRASLLLLVATKNAEMWLMNHINLWLEAKESLHQVDLSNWYITAGRLLLAIGVVESMPDQDLFSIIHPGPKWKYDRRRTWRDNARSECWPLCRGLLCQHLNRSSPVFAILTVIFDGTAGWVFFALAIVQYLIIGLVTSRDRALDVLSQFDRVVAEKRQEIVAEFVKPPVPDEPLREIPRDAVCRSSLNCKHAADRFPTKLYGEVERSPAWTVGDLDDDNGVLLMSDLISRRSAVVMSLLTAGLWAAPLAAQGVTVDQILKYKPVQPGVEVENPKPEEIAQCKVEVERGGKGSGWVVQGPNGQLLRRFVDTDGDNVVDQWRYYQHGLEVYRDIDTNANNEVDQSRWLNMGGSRWGVDTNEDGKLDRWLRLSAEEATREAIHAMAAKDPRALAAVMLDAQDIKALELDKAVIEELTKSLTSVPQQMQDVLSQTKAITTGTKWVRFDSSMLMPNLVPREAGKAARDLVVYENVMSIVETGGQTAFVQMGELVQVGDVWKLTGVPRPLEGDNTQVVAGGVLMQPSVAALTEGSVQLSPEVQKLIESLQKLDESAPGVAAKKEEAVRYNVARAQMLAQLAAATDGEERELWQRQRVDGITAAVQMDAYPNGLGELAAIEQQLPAASPLKPYVMFHRLAADYNLKLQTADNDTRDKIQTEWVTALETFVTDFPKSDDAADALLQLGVAQEFTGKPEDAQKWYARLVQEHPKSPAAGRGRGALTRLALVGNPIAFSGSALGGGTLDVKSYRGKVLAVIFWATWCKPCTEELPQMLELYRTHRADGFEVIGVNLDAPGAPVQKYIQDYKVPWPHVAEEGGLESRPAQEFGIITLPTMFLVDRQGRVVSANISIEDLKKQVPGLVKP